MEGKLAIWPRLQRLFESWVNPCKPQGLTQDSKSLCYIQIIIRLLENKISL